MDMFEWDEAKNASNIAKHGISFETAAAIWRRPTVQRQSDRAGEERYVSVGWVEGRHVAVVWTPRPEGRRLISARRARKNEQQEYDKAFAERAARGTD